MTSGSPTGLFLRLGGLPRIESTIDELPHKVNSGKNEEPSLRFSHRVETTLEKGNSLPRPLGRCANPGFSITLAGLLPRPVAW